MPYLEIHHGDKSQEFALVEKSYILGRAEEADLVLNDTRCSKRHCELTRQKGAWRIRDLASANGTLLNGAEISQVALNDGDEIAIGDVLMVFYQARPQTLSTSADSTRGSQGANSTKKANKSKSGLIFMGVACVLALLVYALGSGDPKDSGGSEESTSPGNSAAAPMNDSSREAGEALGGVAVELDPLLREALGTLRGQLAVIPFVDMKRELFDLELQSQGSAVLGEIQEFRRSLEGRYKTRFDGELSSILAQQKNDIETGGYGRALGRYDELLVSAQASGSSSIQREIRQAKLALLMKAKKQWLSLRNQIEVQASKGDFAAARTQLNAESSRFRGTNFLDFARSELALLDLREAGTDKVAKSSDGSSGTQTNSSSGAKRDLSFESGAVDALAIAEKLAAARDWSAAAKSYDTALTMVHSEKIHQRWKLRRDALFALGRLKGQVITNINAEDKRIRAVKLGRVRARPFAADTEEIQLKFGRAGEVKWQWRDMPVDRLIALFKSVLDQGPSRLEFARACRELGASKVAEMALFDAAKRKALRADAVQLYAAWQGNRLPAASYVFQDGRFYSPDDIEAMAQRKQAARLCKNLVKAKTDKFRESAFQVQAMGEVASDLFAEALKERYEHLLESTNRLRILSAAGKTRTRLNRELETRRQNALALIFDSKRYPYPYGPNQKEVQAEVDGLVNLAREIYLKPSQFLRQGNEPLRLLYNDLVQTRQFMPAFAREELAAPDVVYDKIDEVLNMKVHSWSARDKKANQEALDFNANIVSSITPEEREVHRLTNAYRMIMGRRAVKIEETLVLAARGHSQEMKDKGYFAHNSPTPERRSPSMRARLAGWPGGCSENIARGQRTPAGAVNGWIGSSGHHRNILGTRHTHLGCGKAKDGFFWTQNFATGVSTDLSKKTKPKQPKKGQ